MEWEFCFMGWIWQQRYCWQLIGLYVIFTNTGSNRLSCIVPLPPLKVWFYRGEKTSSPCAVPVQCRSATEQAQRAGVGQVVCTIYWFINYLFFFLLSSILCDLRLFTFFILPPCTPFPNLFFSNVISSGSFFPVHFFFHIFEAKNT